jgi:hypothetical protein
MQISKAFDIVICSAIAPTMRRFHVFPNLTTFFKKLISGKSCPQVFQLINDIFSLLLQDLNLQFIMCGFLTCIIFVALFS